MTTKLFLAALVSASFKFRLSTQGGFHGNDDDANVEGIGWVRGGSGASACSYSVVRVRVGMETESMVTAVAAVVVVVVVEVVVVVVVVEVILVLVLVLVIVRVGSGWSSDFGVVANMTLDPWKAVTKTGHSRTTSATTTFFLFQTESRQKALGEALHSTIIMAYVLMKLAGVLIQSATSSASASASASLLYVVMEVTRNANTTGTLCTW